ncbi:MAG TPA: PEP-CTERM sorting domain-containing protein, partial [Steroidobacteraceae bacterium]|nr:PEP-CTERM sorting domain-containing protein [Steroidobacteraceae bacterium]
DANTSDTLGPVTTTTPTFAGFPAGVAGTYDQTFDMTQAGSYRAGFITDAGGISSAEAALFSGIAQGRAYLNIHTINFAGGEIRGFLQPVPEPATLLLMGAGMAGLVVIRRRRRV